MARNRSQHAGFTLLEVLVAGLIAAMALSVLFHTGLSGLSATRTALAYEQALSLAESHLAAAGVTLTPGEAQGQDGPFAWRTRVAAVATTAPSTDLVQWVRHPGEGPVTLFQISVMVSWRPGRQVRLQTERLGFIRP